MTKLVASDLDGTLLLNGAQSLPEELFPLIKKLKELGILFVAASGRQYANMKRLFEPVADEMAFISENGGLAVQNEKVLYQDSFPPALVKELVEAIYDRKGAEFTCSTKDESFDEIKEPCMKVAVYERGGIQEESIRYWRERFGDKCTVVTSGFAWVDFVPFETNKARGLKEYQKRFGIKPEECVVFGDEYNDIAMLESVPYSFAMAHAKPGVKRAAAYQTERVELILEKLIRAGGNIEEVLRECIQKKA